MKTIFLHINPTQLISVIFVITAFFLLYQYLETFWSYKISKPHIWEEAVKKKLISKELVRLERRYRDKVRFYNLWFQIERLKKNDVKGAFAELGVHRGQTAKAVHHMDPDRKFFLFDTFKGFPKEDLKHEMQADGRFSTEMFADTNVDQVQAYINGNENLIFKQGFFPDTTEGLENEKFAFVNIDADLYAPTIAALRFFYPMLSVGGVMIVHDYNHTWDGIPKALDEFMPTIKESLVELSDWQGSAMIIKSAY
ncbi:MAG: hypothetical protein GY816_08865 [Cytophagales bacterium]|nr:hypothetical protein [Cytophagales bacterium]